MKYFLDTEFIEDGKTIDLISIAIVSEDDRELYLQNGECKLHLASKWVIENVFPSLNDMIKIQSGWTRRSGSLIWLSRKEIRDRILYFINKPLIDNNIEFWAYYSSYDWVVFCQLFGRMIYLPNNFPMYCNDLKQWQMQLAPSYKFPKMEKGEHNALEDARWTRDRYKDLVSLELDINRERTI